MGVREKAVADRFREELLRRRLQAWQQEQETNEYGFAGPVADRVIEVIKAELRRETGSRGDP